MRYSSRTFRTGTLVALPAVLAFLALAAAAAASDAYLGITMTNLTPSMSRALKLDEGVGVLVDRVVAGSPAEQAGLESGDVILAIDDEKLGGNRDLTRLLRDRNPGDEVKLTIQREGKQRRLKATLGERPQRQVDGRGLGDAEIWRWFDGDEKDTRLILRDLGLNKLTRGYLGIVAVDEGADRDRRQGAAIGEVVENSPASRVGLAVDDLIVAIDGKTIDGTEALEQFLDETKPGDEIKVRVVRGGKEQEFTIELAGISERFRLAELIKRHQAKDGSLRGPGRRFVMPAPPAPPTPPGAMRHLDAEREDLEELKDELEELKVELRKLREELQKQR
jgi:predicted metalloprotease with PDZ domain